MTNTAKAAAEVSGNAGREAGEGVRVTVILSEKSRDALKQLARDGNYSSTDIINRAIQQYAFLEQVTADGKQILVGHPGHRAQVVKFL